MDLEIRNKGMTSSVVDFGTDALDILDHQCYTFIHFISEINNDDADYSSEYAPILTRQYKIPMKRFEIGQD